LFSCLFSNYALAESISVTISGPSKGLVNEELSYSVNIKEEWIIESADWEFGDGTSSEGTSVSHKFSNTGKFSVKVTVDAYKKVINDEGSTEKKTGSGSATKKVTCMGKISISADPKTLSADGESTSTISVSTLDVSGNPFNCKRDIELSVSESDSNNNDNELPSLPNLPSFPRKLGEAGANGNASSSSDILSLSSLEMENGSGTATATAGTKAGTAKIKAKGSYLSSASCTIKVEESKKLKLSISASPDILPADGKSQTTLTVKVLDDEGHLNTTYNGSVSLQSSNASALKVPNSVSIKEGKGAVKANAGSSAAEVFVKASSDGLEAASCKVTVFKVSLSVDKAYIAAESDWTGIDNGSQEALITVNIQPKSAEDKIADKITLEILKVTGGGGYNPGKGTLKKSTKNSNLWKYVPFKEAKNEKHPESKHSNIRAIYKGNPCSNVINIEINPIFIFLKGKGGYWGHNDALRYVEWKYDFGGKTGQYNPYGSGEGNAKTNPAGKTFYYNGAFASENLLASSILHEQIHQTQGFLVRFKAVLSYPKWTNGTGNGYDWAVCELEPHEAEVNCTYLTGLKDSDYINKYLKRMIRIFKGILKKYKTEGPK
jgi:hypothetical protein